jgi:hypothetical protein
LPSLVVPHAPNAKRTLLLFSAPNQQTSLVVVMGNVMERVVADLANDTGFRQEVMTYSKKILKLKITAAQPIKT